MQGENDPHSESKDWDEILKQAEELLSVFNFIN